MTNCLSSTFATSIFSDSQAATSSVSFSPRLNNLQSFMGVFHQRVAALFSCQISGGGIFDIRNVETAVSFDVCHRPDCRKDPHMVPNKSVGLSSTWGRCDPCDLYWQTSSDTLISLHQTFTEFTYHWIFLK